MEKKIGVADTPLMKQYNLVKSKYPGAILLFRVGDFYETFGEDAIKTSQILGIVLTKRANGTGTFIELAGFPYHALDTYLPKLVRAGQRVAICDQLEDPKLTKKIVKRGVTELITPGVSYNDKILDHKYNNYLCSIHFEKENCGVAFLDISTGEFMAAEGNIEFVEKLVQSFKPAEIVISKSSFKQFKKIFGEKFYSFQLDDWIFQYQFAYDKLIGHFNTASLKGFGIHEMTSAIVSAGVCLHYLSETHHDQVNHIRSISRIEEEKYVWLDKFTIRNLELLYSAHENGVSLLQVIDKTITPMGARLLKRWLAMPLKEISQINERLDIVDHVVHDGKLYENVIGSLKQIGDLERLISKVAMKRINPRELFQLNRAIKNIGPIKKVFEATENLHLKKISGQINECNWVIEQIEKILKPDPPVFTNRGEIINTGVNEELDELRQIAFSGKDFLLQIQQREQEKTGITSLKVSFNNVFGYYIEVTNTHKSKVPPEWTRKQTLTNAERYITDELKIYEEKILGAEEKITSIEEKIYNELIDSLTDFVAPIQQKALILARIDCLFSFAFLAEKNHYTKPEVNESLEIIMKDARHPVIEKQLPAGEKYVANDIYLDNEKQQLIILTGPNMSGKSALLRQTALNVILAQIGSFVPASFAQIGFVDKIFTRVGASDNISGGESTFMVEMTETASILNNLSQRSLILLDEIGRGTSTYDGVSIAWAIAEFLSNHPAKPKTLFATHYHELNELEQKSNSIKNFHIEIKETENRIIFIRKLKEGGSEHSFGIHVAKMAGVPQIVVQRAKQILADLESQRDQIGDKKKGKPNISNNSFQMSMFQLNDPVLEKLRDELYALEIDTLSPIEALMKLNEIKKMLKN